MPAEIYLDNNATTHLSDAVRCVLSEAIRNDLGNASSSHRSGEKTRREITLARDSVARMLGASPESVVFGSGVTELNYWVMSHLLRTQKKRHLITTEVEHTCVLRTSELLESEGVEVTRLPVLPSGRIDVADLLQSLRPDTSLVSIQWVNNETGVIQPVHEIAKICAAVGVRFHCDAAQAMGKIEINFDEVGIDYLTVSAHKMHGPAGVGAVCIKEPRSLSPMLQGGDQERGLRPGTENTLGIVGFGQAAEERLNSLEATISQVSEMRDRFEALVLAALPLVTINGSLGHRVCNTTNLSFEDLDGAAIVAMLDREGIRCSQSSACTSNRPEPSYVLRAMGLSEEKAFASVRFSFSNQNTMAEVETAATKLALIVARLSGFQSPQSQSEQVQGAAKHEV